MTFGCDDDNGSFLSHNTVFLGHKPCRWVLCCYKIFTSRSFSMCVSSIDVTRCFFVVACTKIMYTSSMYADKEIIVNERCATQTFAIKIQIFLQFPSFSTAPPRPHHPVPFHPIHPMALINLCGIFLWIMDILHFIKASKLKKADLIWRLLFEKIATSLTMSWKYIHKQTANVNNNGNENENERKK